MKRVTKGNMYFVQSPNILILNITFIKLNIHYVMFKHFLRFQDKEYNMNANDVC